MSLYIINKFQFESLDIETIWDNNIAKPFCVSITKNNKIDFFMVKINELESNKIIEFIINKCSKKKIYYVHNLTFESFVFLNYLVKFNIKFKIISNNKIVYSLMIGDIKLRCSYRLTMLSLKKLSEISGNTYKEVFPYKILNKEIKEYMNIEKEMFNNDEDFEDFKKKNGVYNINIFKILQKYCENDSIITKNSIIKYWETIETNGLKYNKKILTAARLSVENYFNLDTGFKIKKKINIKDDRIIRKSYFGGRTEVFGNMRDGEIALHFDWSGMYAQCMSEKVLGGELVKSDKVLDIKNPGYYWIIFEQRMDIPILPIKRDKLLFVNGIFEGWYWFEEILLAIDYGVRIIDIKGMISSQYYDYFLKDFVDINNKIREKGGLFKQIGKNNNNSFYGRLGMNPERLEEEITNKELIKNNYVKIRELNNVFIGYKKKEKSISNVLVASSITSKARIKLYKGMMDVINEGGRILYTDTDSIIAAFDKRNYREKLDKKIGEVYFDSKKDDTIIKDSVFAMPKTYALKFENNKEIVKIKGFNSLPSFNEFKIKFYKKEDINTINKTWVKKDFNIKIEETIKKTNLYSLDKRKWNIDLKSTYPLEF